MLYNLRFLILFISYIERVDQVFYTFGLLLIAYLAAYFVCRAFDYHGRSERPALGFNRRNGITRPLRSSF